MSSNRPGADWCSRCCTRHEPDGDCRGPLLATGPERYGRKFRVKFYGQVQLVGVLVAEAGDHWRGRILTFPSMLWSVPGSRETMKFVGKSPRETEQAAVDFIHEHCRQRGLKISDEVMATEQASVDAEAAPKQAPRGAAEERHEHSLEVRFGEEKVATKGQTANLSHGGLFVSTPRPVSKGKPVRLLLQLGRYTIPLSGKVAWTRQRPESGRPVGMGIDLVNAPPMYRQYVTALERESARKG